MADVELEMLKTKKLRELERKIKVSELQPPKKDPFEVVGRMLVGRGREVLKAARIQHPEASKIIVNRISELIEKGELNEPITGELLHELFRVLGFPVRLETKVFFVEHGKVKSLAEKLKED